MWFCYVLIFLMLVVGLAPMLWEVQHRRFDFFNLKNPFIIYFLIQLGLSGLVTLTTGRGSPEIGLDPYLFSGAYEKALLLSCIGLLCFQAGYYLRRPVPVALPALLTARWQGDRYARLAGLYLGVGILAFVGLMLLNGGVMRFIEDRDTWRYGGGISGQGFLIFPATAVMTLGYLVYFIGNCAQGRLKILQVGKCTLLFCLALLPLSILAFRSMFMLPMVQYLVAWNFCYRRLGTRGLIFCLCGLAVMFTFYGLYREAASQGRGLTVHSLLDVASESPELLYEVVLRSRGTEVVAAVVDQLDRTGDYEYGWRAVYEALTIFVPRKLWIGKPPPLGERFGTYFFDRDLSRARGGSQDAWGGISPTVVGELYWHFGWAGVVLGLFFLGRIGRAVYSTFQRYGSSPGVILIYAVVYTSFAMFAEAMQGYVNGLVLYAAVLFPTLVILASAHRTRVHPATVAPQTRQLTPAIEGQ